MRLTIVHDLDFYFGDLVGHLTFSVAVILMCVR